VCRVFGSAKPPQELKDIFDPHNNHLLILNDLQSSAAAVSSREHIALLPLDYLDFRNHTLLHVERAMLRLKNEMPHLDAMSPPPTA
jgi:hypothetical protein